MADKIYFDSHTHIDTCVDKRSSKADIIRDIEASELSAVVDVGFDIASSECACANADEFEWCYSAVGIHPHDAKTLNPETLRRMRELSSLPKTVAIGEIGLDYYRDYSPRDVQRDAFRTQLRLAIELGMPIIIHDRESGGETIRILEEEAVFSKSRTSSFPAHADGGPDARLLLHCYVGDIATALWLISQGATISLAGPVTYKNNEVSKQVAMDLPIERLLVETDAPYLSPQPMRGKANKSPFVKYTADYIAELRGMDKDDFARRTAANARRFFGI